MLEYVVDSVYPSDLENTLNTRARSGWTVVTVFPSGGGDGKLIVTYQRTIV